MISTIKQATQAENNAMAQSHQFESIFLTEAEYLATEPVSDVKREYIDGQVYAMVGAGYNHNCILANVVREFSNHLKGTPCGFRGGHEGTFGKRLRLSRCPGGLQQNGGWRLLLDIAGDHCRSIIQDNPKDGYDDETDTLRQPAVLTGICLDRTGYCLCTSAA